MVKMKLRIQLELPQKKKISANEYVREPIKEACEGSNNLKALGDTRYSGKRNFDTSLNSNWNYELQGTSPAGISNETFSYEGCGGVSISLIMLLSESLF
jgi:hypothetical protein